MTKIIIRDLQKQDVIELSAIYDLYWTDIFREKLTRKINEFITNSEKAHVEKVHYYVVEFNNEILGAISFRDAPEPMLKYTKSSNPLEVYILAVREKGKGIGKILIEKMILEGKKLGYTEAVLFNSDSHDESRGFYIKTGFIDAGKAVAPDGELGRAFTLLF
jgi:L-amino acid N-acyltransferase YncA